MIMTCAKCGGIFESDSRVPISIFSGLICRCTAPTFQQPYQGPISPEQEPTAADWRKAICQYKAPYSDGESSDWIEIRAREIARERVRQQLPATRLPS